MRNFIPMIAFAAILLVPIVSAYGQSATGTVTITAPPTCGLSLSQTTINYGSVASGATATATFPTNGGLGITNTGTVPTTSVDVIAADWYDNASPPVEHIKVQNTAESGEVSGPFAPLSIIGPGNTNSITPISGALGPGNGISTYWQLTANLDNTPFSGTLTQTLTFVSAC